MLEIQGLVMKVQFGGALADKMRLVLRVLWWSYKAVFKVLERSYQGHICLRSLIFHQLIMFCFAKCFQIEFGFFCLFVYF